MGNNIAISIWEMVKEAAEALNREVGYAEIKQYIRSKYGDINDSSMTCSIISASVNHASRIHYAENQKPRLCNGAHDFLLNTGRGRVTLYAPEKHGQWEIYAKDDGLMAVRQVESAEDDFVQEPDLSSGSEIFALESHLRDYMAKYMGKLNGVSNLTLYRDNGRDGVEFQTDVGPIDILASDSEGNFVVFELKLTKGPDACLGQILRYMGWVEKHLANGKKVNGIIVASEIPKKLRYAVTQVPSVSLLEYSLSFSIKPVQL